MKSKWYEFKEAAILLRRQGFSIGKVEKQLGIPRSTLSGWFRNIKLNKKQKEKILREWRIDLGKARKKAVFWHNEKKRKRIEEAEKSAKETLDKIDINNHAFLELALAFLYLGEGSKKNVETALGSSDSRILKFFLSGLKKVYHLDISRIKCDLGLRADQDPEKMRLYWSKALKLPIRNFTQINIDKRTEGKETYLYYKGVCHLRCGNVAIQRRLVSLANLYCDKIVLKNTGS